MTVFSLEQKPIQHLQVLVLALQALIFLGQLLIFLLEGGDLLVEVQKGALQYDILLVFGQIERLLNIGLLLLQNFVAGLRLFLQNLDGNVEIVLEFLQKIAHFGLVEVGISLQDDSGIVFNFELVGVVALVLVDDGVLGGEVVFAEEGLELKFAGHSCCSYKMNYMLLKLI